MDEQNLNEIGFKKNVNTTKSIVFSKYSSKVYYTGILNDFHTEIFIF